MAVATTTVLGIQTWADADAVDLVTHCVTLGHTQLENVLTGSVALGGTLAVKRAGSLLTATNTNDGATSQVAILEGDRATMAANDEAYLTLRLSDSAGNQDEFARITWRGTTVTSASEVGRLTFSVISAGSLSDEWQITPTALAPSSNDGAALGVATNNMISDIYLASGAVIDFNAGNYTATHSAGLLTFSGSLAITGALSGVTTGAFSSTVTIAAGGFSVTGDITHRSGAAGTNTRLQIGRTANEVSLNVAGGANQMVTGAVAGDGVLRYEAGVLYISNAGTSVAKFGSDSSTTLGGALALGTNNLTMTGTISTTGSRITKSWHTDITSTNAVTVDSSLLSKVPESIFDYAGDALAILRGVRVVSYRHHEYLDASNRVKLGVVAESVTEPLALQEIENPQGGVYPGVNLMGLLALQTRAIQQIEHELQALRAGRGN